MAAVLEVELVKVRFHYLSIYLSIFLSIYLVLPPLYKIYNLQIKHMAFKKTIVFFLNKWMKQAQEGLKVSNKDSRIKKNQIKIQEHRFYDNLFISLYMYIYIYIVIHRQTVSLYLNSSVRLSTQDASSCDRNPSNFTLDLVSYR